MCSSYTSGLCGAPEPARDLGEMPSARSTPPDVPGVLTPERWRQEPLLHYGDAEMDAPTAAIVCGASDGYCTSRLDHLTLVTCPDCVAAIRRQLAGAHPAASGNEAA